MNRLTKIIKEVLSSPPKKDCGCGCHEKCTKSPTLNENLGVKVIMTENMKYHIDNKKPLIENTFRYGSKAFLDLWAEARYLYSRDAIDLSESDKQIILETHLGERGLFNGELVPLDLPMEDLEENTDDVVAVLNNPNIADDVKSMLFNAYKNGQLTSTQVINIVKKTVKEHLNEAQMLDNYEVDFFHTKANIYANIEIPSENPTFEDDLQIKGIGKTEEEAFEDLKQNYNNYKKTGINEAEYDFNINKVWDFIESRPFNNPNYMPKFSTAKEIWDEWGDKEKQLYNDFQWEDKYNGQLHPKETRNLQRRKNYDSLAGINESEYQGKKVQLNKPKRGGSKKFYVYVRDPKTKKVKKVSFGDTTGLSTKINNPKARKAFAARQQCDKKKDRTKAGYWACNIGKYWKSLGGSNNFSGYW